MRIKTKAAAVVFSFTFCFCAFAAACPEPVIADTVGAYYASVTATGGIELLGQLHDLITTTHVYYSTYADCRDYGPTTDPGQDGVGITEFYTHETVETYVGSSGAVGKWNREHVWCKSHSNGLWTEVKNTNRGGGADLHHIRPSEMSMNSTRGNDKYGVVTEGKEVWSKKIGGALSACGGRLGGGAFEPLDTVKGDVARILFYVYTHYNTYSNVGGTVDGGSPSYFGTLHFTDIVAESTESEAVTLLLAWNALDPVDDIERYRNEQVYLIQKNRNPFIDDPTYADDIWGTAEQPPVDPVDPPAGDPEAPAAFRAAVEAIPAEGTLEARYRGLVRAIAAYRALSEAQKEEAAAGAEALKRAVEAYNAALEAYDRAADSADGIALGCAGRLLG